MAMARLDDSAGARAESPRTDRLWRCSTARMHARLRQYSNTPILQYSKCLTTPLREPMMERARIRAKLLELYPAFRSLPAERLDQILGEAVIRTAPAGTVMFDERN